MTIKHIIVSVLEFSAIGFIFWGLFNQDKLIEFENKIKRWFKR